MNDVITPFCVVQGKSSMHVKICSYKYVLVQTKSTFFSVRSVAVMTLTCLNVCAYHF